MCWIYLNGELVRRAAAPALALDRGLLYGYGLFETMRAYSGRVFRLEAHYGRLCQGAAILAMAVPFSLPGLSGAVAAVLERNELKDARIRLTLTPGAPPAGRQAPPGPLGEPAVPGHPTVVLFVRPLTEYPPSLYRCGMSAVVSVVRRNEWSPLSRVKSLNYLDNLLAREDARKRGADEAVLLNTRGLLAEGSASNVFLARDGRLLTPAVESGALPGITRQTVLELAAAAGLEAVEAEVEPSALADAAEAFLTNSVMEVMPLTRLDGRPLGSGRPGPVTKRLQRLYREAVRRATFATLGST